MKPILLILLAAIAFVIASVSSTVITNKIETKPESPAKEEVKPKEEAKPAPAIVQAPAPAGPGNIDQPYHSPPLPQPTGPGNL